MALTFVIGPYARVCMVEIVEQSSRFSLESNRLLKYYHSWKCSRIVYLATNYVLTTLAAMMAPLVSVLVFHSV